MNEAYKDDKVLCQWLISNSAGVYRLSAYAAERITTLNTHIDNVQLVCDNLEAEMKEMRKVGVCEWSTFASSNMYSSDCSEFLKNKTKQDKFCKHCGNKIKLVESK